MTTRQFCAALALALLCATAPAFAQSPASTSIPVQTPASTVPAFLDAKGASVPGRARVGLPRGARTVFCLKTQLEGKPVLLHGWKRAKSDATTLDIFAVTRSSRGKKGARRAKSVSTLRRLNRVLLGDVTSADEGPGVSMSIETTSLDARTKRGLVMVLEWPYHNVSFSYSYVPMVVVTLPGGLSGRAFAGDFTTETEPGGGTLFQPRVGADGRFFLRKKDYASDAGTARYTPFTWDGTGYKAGQPGAEQPDTD